MNRRLFLASFATTIAGVVCNPTDNHKIVYLDGVAWTVIEGINERSKKQVIQYVACYCGSGWTPAKLPPIKPGFSRQLLDLQPKRLSSDGSPAVVQITIIDEMKWVA